MKSVTLVCSNCDSVLCDIFYYENRDNVFKAYAKCPCGDKSFPKYIDCVKYSPVAGDGFILKNVNQTPDSKEIIIEVENAKKTV